MKDLFENPRPYILGGLLLLALPSYLFSQQIADTSYNPVIAAPAYDSGEGPVVFLDEGRDEYRDGKGKLQIAIKYNSLAGWPT